MNANDSIREAMPVTLLAIQRRVFNDDTLPNAGEVLLPFVFEDPTDLVEANRRLASIVQCLLTFADIGVGLLAERTEDRSIERCMDFLCSSTSKAIGASDVTADAHPSRPRPGPGSDTFPGPGWTQLDRSKSL